jgi:hypothetical protein
MKIILSPSMTYMYFFKFTITCIIKNSLVSKVTVPSLEDQASTPVDVKTFHFATTFRPTLKTSWPPAQWVLNAFSFCICHIDKNFAEVFRCKISAFILFSDSYRKN